MGHWTDMHPYSAGHWIAFLIFAAVVIYPLGRILGRMGFSRLWAILAFVPVVNLVALWVIAFTDWPRLAGSDNT